MTGWQAYAGALADQVMHPASRWYRPVAETPRHAFVPAWWEPAPGGWERRDAGRDTQAAYADTSLVTRVGPLHADHSQPARHAAGRPTSSSTKPSLLLTMNRYAHLADGTDVLEVGTGSGYNAALLAARLGDRHVTSIDIDPYLVDAAARRLAGIGLAPALAVADATTAVDGTYDRIISTVALRPVPPALVKALRPGGRLVAVLSGIRAVLTADRLDDGRLYGRIEHADAGFMDTRNGRDYAPAAPAPGPDAEGEHVGPGRYPLADPDGHWELASMLAVEHPGVQIRWTESAAGAACTLWDGHGSWARAEGTPGGIPTVHESGPQRLWSDLDGLKDQWLVEGGFPLYGAAVMVGADGSVDVMRGTWRRRIC